MAVGWGVVEDTLKAEVERRKENVGKRVTKVNPRNGAVMGKNFKMAKPSDFLYFFKRGLYMPLV